MHQQYAWFVELMTEVQAGFNSARRWKAKHWTQNQLTTRMHNYQKILASLKMFKTFIPPQTDGMIRLYLTLVVLNPK